MSAKSLLKQREDKAFAAGGGTWFRKSDDALIVVIVQFYPKTSLWIENAGCRYPVTKDELEKDYYRLRL